MRKLTAQITLTSISLLSVTLISLHSPHDHDDLDPKLSRSTSLYPAGLTAYLCAILILAFGLPHGALDHILYHLARKNKAELQAALSKTSTDTPSKGQRPDVAKSVSSSRSRSAPMATPPNLKQPSTIHSPTFYLNYLGMMSCWGISWVLWPFTSFWSFLAVSAWHFGEGDLGCLAVSKPFKPFLFLSRGCLIIGLTMTVQPEVTLPIIQHLINMPQEYFCSLSEMVPPVVCVFHFTTLWRLWCLVLIQDGQAVTNSSPHPPTISKPQHSPSNTSASSYHPQRNNLVFPATRKSLNARNLAIETAKSALFVSMFIFLNPLVAFSIYFGCWHGMGCICDFIEWLKTNECAGFSLQLLKHESGETVDASVITMADFLYFYLLAAPYTIISLCGMFSLYFLATWMDTAAFTIMQGLDVLMVWAVFIGCISVLTGGHVWVLLGMYWPLVWDADPLSVN